MKKLTTILLTALIGLLAIVPFTKAQAKSPANIYIFHGDGCGFCKAALAHFDELENEYGNMFDLKKYEVWNDSKNADLMQTVAEKLNEEVTGVPFIIIGKKVFKGYSAEYDEDILEAIKELYESEERYDVISEVGDVSTSASVYVVLAVIIVGIISLLAFSKAKAN